MEADAVPQDEKACQKFNTAPLMQFSKQALIALVKDIVEKADTQHPRAVVESHVNSKAQNNTKQSSAASSSTVTCASEMVEENLSKTDTKSGKKGRKEKEFSMAK